MCDASHRTGQWFISNTVHHFHGLERTKRPLIQLLVLFNKHRGITSKSKYMVKYSDLPSTIRPVPHSQELPVAEPLEYLTFSDDSSDSDEDHRQQERGNVDCDLIFVASCSSSEPHLLYKEAGYETQV
jgi:hypothetical protein